MICQRRKRRGLERDWQWEKLSRVENKIFCQICLYNVYNGLIAFAKRFQQINYIVGNDESKKIHSEKETCEYLELLTSY